MAFPPYDSNAFKCCVAGLLICAGRLQKSMVGPMKRTTGTDLQKAMTRVVRTTQRTKRASRNPKMSIQKGNGKRMLRDGRPEPRDKKKEKETEKTKEKDETQEKIQGKGEEAEATKGGPARERKKDREKSKPKRNRSLGLSGVTSPTCAAKRNFLGLCCVSACSTSCMH